MKNKLFLSAILCICTLQSIANGITGALAVCVNATTSLTGTPGGGTWSAGTFTTIATIDVSGAVTGVTAGTARITYNQGGTNYFAVVTVNPLPAAITGTLTVCEGSTTTLHDATTGGTWSSSNTSSATISSGGVVTGVLAGTSTISYTLNSGCGAVGATVTVNPVPAAITGPSAVCKTYTITLTDATPGGTWSTSVNYFIQLLATPGVVMGNQIGSEVVTYTVGGCKATLTVTCNDIPAGITNTPFLAVLCPSAGNIIFNDATSGGTWTTSNAAIADVNATTGNVNAVSVGIATITYTRSNGCFVTENVTVNPTPHIITGDTHICVHDTGSVIDSGGYWWSSNTAVGTISPSGIGHMYGVSAGTTIITFALTSSLVNVTNSGCYVTTAVTVGVGPIVGSSAVCVGGVSTLTDGAYDGSWSSNNTSVATIDAGSGIVSGVAAGSAVITFTYGDFCYATTIVTVQHCCLTNSLTINTGYDPLGDSAMTGQSDDGGSATTDAKWIVSDISPDAVSVISANGYTRVANGDKADIVTADLPVWGSAWATHGSSGWITAQNAHGYMTPRGTDSFSMTLTRPFSLCSGDDIVVDLNIANDNYIASMDIDGTPLSFSQAPSDNSANFNSFTHFSTTQSLSSGTHYLNIVIVNYNEDSVMYNPTGLNVYGTLSSATSTSTFIREDKSSCSSYTCSDGAKQTAPAQQIEMQAGELACFPNPNTGAFTLKGTLSGITASKEVKIEVLNMLGKVEYSGITPVNNGAINKSITLGDGIANGIYFIRISCPDKTTVIRFALDR